MEKLSTLPEHSACSNSVMCPLISNEGYSWDCPLVKLLYAFMQTQKSQWVGYQGTVDYTGKQYTASLTMANPDVFTGSGVVVAQ